MFPWEKLVTGYKMNKNKRSILKQQQQQNFDRLNQRNHKLPNILSV